MIYFICRNCGKLPSKEFYLGNKSLCKKCYKKRATETRNKKIDHYQEYDRGRANLPHRIKLRKKIALKWKKDPILRAIANKQKNNWIKNHKEERAAHLLVQYAIKAGKLSRLPCVVCGNPKSEAHHEDYTKPLDVNWLCKKHHAELHKEKRKH